MPKFILITHQKGGVGKSTLAFNLASNIKYVAKTCIIDMDYQGSLNNIKNLSDISIFAENDLKDIINSDYDFVFIDTPPYLSDRLSELCSLA